MPGTEDGTNLPLKYDLRVADEILTKENMEGLNSSSTRTIVQSMLLFSWLDLPETLPERKIVRLCFVLFFSPPSPLPQNQSELSSLVSDLIDPALLANTHLFTNTSVVLMFASERQCIWKVYLTFTAISPECSRGLFPFSQGSSLLGHCWLHQCLLTLFAILCVCIQAVRETYWGHQTLANALCHLIEVFIIKIGAGSDILIAQFIMELTGMK